MMLLGIGTKEAVTAALVYLLAHACYKCALFLVAGTLEHETGTRDVTNLGGLRHSMPLTALAGALAACSMAGIPLFLGFTAKELLYDALLSPRGWNIVLLAVSIAGERSARRCRPDQPVWRLLLDLEVMRYAKHAAGARRYASPIPARRHWSHSRNLAGRRRHARQPSRISARNFTTPVHLAAWHGLTHVLSLSILTLALAAALYHWRNTVRMRIWPRPLGFERLYTSTLHVLDAISARSLHALQGASLRAYVLALIVTTGTLIAAVLLSNGLPGWPGTGDVQPQRRSRR